MWRVACADAQAVSLYEASMEGGCWVAGYLAAKALLNLRKMGALSAQQTDLRAFR